MPSPLAPNLYDPCCQPIVMTDSTTIVKPDHSQTIAAYPPSTWRGARWVAAMPGVVALVLVISGAALFAWLSLMRHTTLQTAALDLGYQTQVAWNTAHGRPYALSLYLDGPDDLDTSQFRRPDILLSIHIELLVGLLAPLMWLYNSPNLLLIIQAVVLASGVAPAFWIARRRLTSGWAGVAFGLMYLWMPAVEGANIADFHGVALTAALLLWAWWGLESGAYRLFGVAAFLATIAKEEVGLLVGLLILVFAWQQRRSHLALVAVLPILWSILCFTVFLPYFNGLKDTSPFWDRYTLFGPTPAAALENLRHNPSTLIVPLRRLDVLKYLHGLWASGGYLALLSPLTLLPAAPILAMNTLSNFDWQYSGGGHYSATIAPFMLLAAILGAERLLAWLSRWGVGRRLALPAVILPAVLIAFLNHRELGLSPWSRYWDPPTIHPRHLTAQRLAAQIPETARVAASSNLYPHVAHREWMHVFPHDTHPIDTIFVDLTEPFWPIDARRSRQALEAWIGRGEFGVVAAEQGFLLLQRGASSQPDLAQAARDFTRPDISVYPLAARFGDGLELVGYRVEYGPAVNGIQLPIRVTTTWRAVQPLTTDYSIALRFTRADGALIGGYDADWPGIVWRPTSTWPPGDLVQLQSPWLPGGRSHAVLIAVAPVGTNSDVLAHRLPVSGAPDLDIRQHNTLLHLTDLPTK